MSTMSVKSDNFALIAGLLIAILGIAMFFVQFAPQLSPQPLNPEPFLPLPAPPKPHPDPQPEPQPTIGKLIEVDNNEDFYQAVRDNPNRAVLICGEDWCRPCKLFLQSGKLEQIRREFPKLTIIKADLRKNSLSEVARKLRQSEANGTLKKFSVRSSTGMFPSFVVRNNIFSGTNEISVRNIRNVIGE